MIGRELPITRATQSYRATDFSLLLSVCDPCCKKVTDQIKGMKEDEEFEHL